ncbi:MAG: acyltransferase [Microbacteriaceae bacterium]|nr:acyltransferase [Microbacteriaceae bacterium]
MTTQTIARTESQATAPVTSRLTSLDGLRGLASLVVVLHHLYLVATPVLSRQGGSGFTSPYWWLSNTPLKLLTAGSEAVLVFFVLSGLVVALPALNRSSFSWAGFFAGRVVRLYLPVWVSLAIGTGLVWLLPRDGSMVTQGAWIDTSNATSTTWQTLLSQATLARASYDINNVLWSLRWELAFSVLLPLLVALAILVRKYWAIAVGCAIAMTIGGALLDVDALRYLPVFFIGTLMAVRLESIMSWARQRQGKHGARAADVAMVVGSLLLIVIGWLLRPLVPSGTVGAIVLAQSPVVGATGLVLSAITVPTVRRALDMAAFQWLGRISFSLYLIHIPIIATLSFVLGDGNWAIVALLTIPLSLLSAWAFHWAVERPVHGLARKTSKAVAAKVVRLRRSGARRSNVETNRPSSLGLGSNR